MADLVRQRHMKKVESLRKALGEMYEVHYDVCESGMTDVYLILKNGMKVLCSRNPNSVFDEEMIMVGWFDQLPTDQKLLYQLKGWL